MKAIGVRELKARLSHYLRDVQAGEVVLVTDRGRVIAELRAPGSAAPAQESDLDRRLRKLAERLPMKIGEPHDPSFYLNRPRRWPPLPAGTAQKLLDEEREDRV
jgi:antitoxin (DNA-binding transcriptional repressor) of toxin-antitoxin stability system